MKKVSAFLMFGFLSYFATSFFVSANESSDIVFTFQNPSYITDKNPLLSEFTCDVSKSDCKVNFDLSSSFT